MTDYDTIKAMLTKAGIYFIDNTMTQAPNGAKLNENMISVPERTLSEGTNRGYDGFVSEFYFDQSGNLVAMGAWE